MNWRFKAVLQQAFSHLPLGASLNYFFQRHVTKTYPRSSEDYATGLAHARAHVAGSRRHGGGPLEDATFFEFGAGWDLLNPLALYAMGVNRQVVVDLRRLLKPSLVAHAAEHLRRLGSGVLARPPVLHVRDGNLITALEAELGIRYIAPCDARATGLPAGSVDCITSTNTLEHVPPDDIPAILLECRRLLRDDGIASFRIDYQDHYSYFDPRTSVYNFLRYSDSRWAFYNAGLQWQNRLRHRDYLGMIEAAGFVVSDATLTEGSAEDLEVLARMRIDAKYRDYAPAELAIRNALLVLRKRNAETVSS